MKRRTVGASAFSGDGGNCVEVSMAALFRLACLSFLFGGVLYLSVRMGRALLRAFSISEREVPKRLRAYLPKRWELYISKRSARPIGAIRRFFLDFSLTVVCGVAFIIFLYWQADGIPRWFVFAAAGGGAYLSARLFGGILTRAERCINTVLLFILLWIWVPVVRAASFAFARLWIGIKKFSFCFIKYAKRLYTIYTAKKYADKTVKSFGERKVSAALRGVIFEEEGK